MENEMLLGQFEEVEQKVEKLIEAYKNLRATNLELLNKIDNLETELQGKIEAEGRFEEERFMVRSRIDALLIRIEKATEAS